MIEQNDNFEIEQLQKTIEDLKTRVKRLEIDLSQQILHGMVIMALLHNKFKVTQKEVKEISSTMQEDIDKAILKNMPTESIN